jgi:hemerythrin-like domain-containing protein
MPAAFPARFRIRRPPGSILPFAALAIPPSRSHEIRADPEIHGCAFAFRKFVYPGNREDAMENGNRRAFLGALGFATGGAVLGLAALPTAAQGKKTPEEKDVGAVEDLMREHGVLRRALLAYAVCSRRLRTAADSVSPEALTRIAKLFRSFGEDYHERKLEEDHIFPLIRKTRGPASAYPDVLIAQHNRGREITGYILKAASGARIAPADAAPLAGVLDDFVWMYEHHAAREDTVVFPAWKDALSAKALDELGEKFEAIEKAEFGKDGFEEALKTMADIEKGLGMTDIGQYTAAPPPKR